MEFSCLIKLVEGQCLCFWGRNRELNWGAENSFYFLAYYELLTTDSSRVQKWHIMNRNLNMFRGKNNTSNKSLYIRGLLTGEMLQPGILFLKTFNLLPDGRLNSFYYRQIYFTKSFARHGQIKMSSCKSMQLLNKYTSTVSI